MSSEEPTHEKTPEHFTDKLISWARNPEEKDVDVTEDLLGMIYNQLIDIRRRLTFLVAIVLAATLVWFLR